MSYKEFPCGCRLETTPNGGVVFDVDNVNLNCRKTWEIYWGGRTAGIFQVETNLGSIWSARLKPEELEHCSALISNMRPGVLEAKSEDGTKNIAQSYVDRKSGIEPVRYVHSSMEKALRDTYGLMIYQENAMNVASILAGFTEVEADLLRSAAGKKDVEKMAKLRPIFLDGCKKVGLINEDIALQVFDNIEKSQRYSFNRCVTGDTKLKKGGNNKYYNFTVEEMYGLTHSLEYAKDTNHVDAYKKFKNKKYGKSWSICDDGRLRPNKIVDIRYAGEQEVYKIRLKNGATVKVTSNHKFPTKNNIKLCSELKIGDNLIVCGEFDKSRKKYGWSQATIEQIRNTERPSTKGVEGFQTGISNPGYVNGAYAEWEENCKKLSKYCVECGKKDCRIEVHHIDGNRENNKIENLKPLCASCHKKIEYANGRVKRGEKGYPTLESEIVEITSIGVKPVYDVEMEGPNHTFTTEDGIVTCNSHGICYGKISYQTAYAKVHFPLEFYVANLSMANEKTKPKEEISRLVNDAKYFDIEIMPPNICDLNNEFYIKDNKIYFGLSHIKGIGEAQIKKLADQSALLTKPVDKHEWFELLLNLLDNLSKTVVEGFINAGALDFLGLSRTKMLYEYQLWQRLTDLEKQFIKNKPGNSFVESLKILGYPKKDGGGCANINRVEIVKGLISVLEKPPYELKDSLDWLAWIEESLLGVSVTCHKTDAAESSRITCTVKEFQKGFNGYTVLGVTLKKVNPYKTKKGKQKGEYMAFITGEDGTGLLDSIVAFVDPYKEYKDLLVEGNTVAIRGSKTKTGSLSIEKVFQI